MRKTILPLVALVVLLWGSHASGQDQSAAPTYNEGDYWHFKVTENIANVASTRELDGMYQVTFSEGKLQVRTATAGGSVERAEAQSELSPSRIFPVLFGLDEKQPDLKFPMSVGQRWKYSYQFRSMGEREYLTRHVQIEVVGIEPITTEAGKFRAFKLIKDAIWSTGGKTPRQNQSTTTYYYSSESRSIVKSTIVSSNGTTREIELISSPTK